MPTYVYKFVDTGETIEVQQAFSDATLTEATHPTTGQMMPVRKVFTPVGVTFKGGGFYKTDSRGGSEAVATGEPIVASARDLPLAMLPAAAVTAPPTGVAAHPLAEGEVVVATDLVDDGGLAPAEWLVFAVPADGSPALAAGDAAAVFGSGQRWCDGVVVALGEQTVEVAVAPDCAAGVSAQLALGAVTLARA
jgi:predicted nucleic acid-binding Zn ribbon protein